MKFKRPEKYNRWTKEKTEEQIKTIWQDIKMFNKRQNRMDSRINEIREEKRILGIKIRNKYKYIKQLEEQLKEITSNEGQET